MSPSDVSHPSDSEVASAISLLERLAHSSDISADSVREVVSSATRLYANASTRAGHELPPLRADVSTTEALTLACALLRSQDLTPFDMAMWFSRENGAVKS